MGNLILSNDFIDLGTITSRSEASGYPDDNIIDKWHMKRRFRADDVNTYDWLLKFDFGAAKSVAAVFLNDINFNKVRIQGHATDVWTSPSYDGADIDISQNILTGRYQIYLPITGFNYQYMRVCIPNGTSGVGDYTAKWEVGTAIVLDSVTELTVNMAYGYERWAERVFEDIPLGHGGKERVGLGDEYKWLARVIFGKRHLNTETELFTLNRMNPATPLIFYENLGSTQDAYLCLRNDHYHGKLIFHNKVEGNILQFEELI